SRHHRDLHSFPTRRSSDLVKNSNGRVKVFTDNDLKENYFGGLNWKEQCKEIIDALPNQVVISCDIDSLYQWYCPNTGTPVPGGLDRKSTRLNSSHVKISYA